jgi:hypothetical protein
MKFSCGQYVLKVANLDNKISINVSEKDGRKIEVVQTQEFISRDNKIIYKIKDFEGELWFKQKIKNFDDYIISFKQTKEGTLEMWYTKLDHSRVAFASHKKINGETLTIAMEKEVK